MARVPVASEFLRNSILSEATGFPLSCGATSSISQLTPGLYAHSTCTWLALAPAPAATVSELQQTLAAASGRFQAMDTAGVLAYVSDRYRNGPITKSSVRDNLLAMFALYDTVRAQVRLDEVRVVNGAAWVYSTGEISGRLRGLGVWTTVLSWEREAEVARREGAAWRLEGPGP